MERKKIIIYVVIGVVMLALVVGTLYFLLSEEEQSVVVTEPSAPDETDVSSANYEAYVDGAEKSNDPQTGTENKIKKVSLLIDEEMVSPAMTADGAAILYLSDESGSIIRYSLSDQTKQTIFQDSVLQYVKDILWSKDRGQAYFDTSKGQYLYDVRSNSITELSKNIRNIKFSPQGNKAAYQYINYVTGENFLSVSDVGGSDWSNLADIEPLDEGLAEGVFFGWFPDSKSLYYVNESLDVSGSEYKKVDIANGNITGLDDWGKIAGIKFFPEMQKAIYVSFDQGDPTPKIWIMDEDGGNKKYTGIDNFADKCVDKNNSDSLVCAISEQVYSSKVNEILVEYDVATGEINPITQLDENNIYNVSNLFVSKDDKKIYFVDNIDNRLYVVE